MQESGRNYSQQGGSRLVTPASKLVGIVGE
jgi:hypothetical protein